MLVKLFKFIWQKNIIIIIVIIITTVKWLIDDENSYIKITGSIA